MEALLSEKMRRLPACFHDKNQDNSLRLQRFRAIYLTEVKAWTTISQ
jgi:hypothetical protein